MTKQASEMWSKVQLYEAMIDQDWLPTSESEDIFIHKRTGVKLDMSKRHDGMTLWMSYALIQKTPPLSHDQTDQTH